MSDFNPSTVNATRGRAKRWLKMKRNRKTGQLEVQKQGFKVREARAYKKNDPLNAFSDDSHRLEALKSMERTKRVIYAGAQAGLTGSQAMSTASKQISSNAALQQSLSGGSQAGGGKDTEEETESRGNPDSL